jgi:hypothetical protein
MPAIDTAAWLRPPFTETMFTVTNWDTAADKADFANTLCRFIAADFKKELFTQKLYRRLNLSFGFIAHYDIGGYFDYFFLDLQGKIAFLEEMLAWWPCGQPEHTFSDVERAVKARLRACDLLDAYRQLRAAEIDGAERALLALLRRKYEGPDPPAPLSAPILHSGTPPKTRQTARKNEQTCLF